ncbi:MAG: hypothetical protein GY820_21355, partial [Gammaproteobacteria bacterium]|nr:hypothetical protein [Gammaproteobacteria bacterium]
MLQVDPLEAITITLDGPQDQLVTNQANINFVGSLNHTATLTLNAEAVTVESDLSFDHLVTLQEGTNNFDLVAIDAVNGQSTVSRQITLDTSIPAIPNLGFITVSLPDENDLVTIEGQAGSVEPFSEVVIVNLRTSEISMVIADANGAFTLEVNGQQGDTYRLLSADTAGNQSDTVELDDGSLPPDPVNVAPPIDQTQTTSLLDATSFLYTGANPIQTGVASGTIEAKRTAVIRGKVLDKLDNPLPGVTITIRDHPEFGQTLSRADGMFDMAVNGGGQFTIEYNKTDYLPVQRYIKTQWRDYFWAEDVVMIQLDSQVTTIDLLSTVPMQVAQGSPVTDVDGTRQATLMIPQGTSASMTLADGTTQSLTTLNVRATEYTVGDNGPESMPGPLPPTSGYTYAVELSVDEAIAAGASTVEFNQPVSFYVNNFLNFPVGEVVPVGFYDRESAAWIPSSNGKIIRLVSVTNGLADISLDPSGTIATQAELDAVGITPAEQSQLADTYTVDTELWRVQIMHLTPWDCNWPYGPPNDATGPEDDVTTENEDKPKDPCEKSGCIIEAENQVLGERIGITGTPYTLNYRSSRVSSFKANRRLNIPLSGDILPSSLVAIELEIRIAGRLISQRYAAIANQTITWEWDGKDGFGRDVVGGQTASVSINYIYNPVYYAARRDFEASFSLAGSNGGGNGSLRVIGDGSSEIKVSRVWMKTLSNTIQNSGSLGGWAISPRHIYDQKNRLLYRGDGVTVNSDAVSNVVKTIGGSNSGFSGDGGPATEATFSLPQGIAIDAEGGVYIADRSNHRIRYINKNGIVDTVAGSGQSGFNGDGGLAIAASLSSPSAVALGQEGDLYIADENNHRIRKVDSDGIITTVAGNGEIGSNGNGGLAILANLHYPSGVAVNSIGEFFITGNSRLRKVGLDGVISTVVGGGTLRITSNYGVATSAITFGLSGVSIDKNDNIYVLTKTNYGEAYKITPDGIIHRIAGNSYGSSNDGDPAINKRLFWPEAIVAGNHEEAYISNVDPWTNTVIKIDRKEIKYTFSGGNSTNIYTSSDGHTPQNTNLGDVTGMAIGPNDYIYLASRSGKIRRVSSAFPGFSIKDIFIASLDGSRLYQFDQYGRHLKTLDSITSAEIFSFTYDSEGLLSAITDINGDVTTINRLTDGTPTTIVAPDGQITTLTLDTNGYLATITEPVGGSSHTMTYYPDGL